MADFTGFSGGGMVWDGGILEIFIYVRMSGKFMWCESEIYDYKRSSIYYSVK